MIEETWSQKKHPQFQSNMITSQLAAMVNLIVSDAFLQSVLSTSTETRQQCMNLIDYSSANLVSTDAHKPSPSDIQRDLTKQQKFLYGRLGELRGLNRNAILQVRETKQFTAEARQEIDRLHLHLQNLYYEERHLRGEIAACESYEYDGPSTCLSAVIPRSEPY